MNEDDFLDFQSAAKTLQFSSVPYTQVKQLKYTIKLYYINFKTQHDEERTTVSIRQATTTRKKIKIKFYNHSAPNADAKLKKKS